MADAAKINFDEVQNFDDGHHEDEMAKAYAEKKKKMAKFKKGLENKEAHAAKIAKRKKEQEEANKKKLEEQEDKVKKLNMMRKGIDPNDTSATVDTAAAYTAFSVLDIDGGGRISLREMQVREETNGMVEESKKARQKLPPKILLQLTNAHVLARRDIWPGTLNTFTRVSSIRRTLELYGSAPALEFAT